MSKKKGEDALLDRLRRLLRRTPDTVHAGIGDDCAAVQGCRRGILTLLKTDCVVEGRHFLPRDPAAAIGWKAACRAVSDIAACGGEPRFALVTCVLRAGQTGRWIAGVYRGIEKAARTYGFHVVGGELAGTDGPAVISVALHGEVASRDFTGRSGGRPGDVLFVTGVLGASLSSGWHLRFRPRVEQARWLVRNFHPRSMMDLSDGLATDLPRLARAGGTGFIVDPALVPRRPGASLGQALGDGEDFELLFAIDPRKADALETAWEKKFPRLRLTRIGRLAPRSVARGLGTARGYDHFASR